MKRLLMGVMVVLAATVFAAAEKGADASSSGLAAARSKITQIVANPKLMASAMKTLSAADQLLFIGEVNRAIEKMSGSEEEKTALFLSVNRSALNGAAKGNLGPVVAEVFATVPVQALTVINESFAQDAFNRAANPKVTYTDEQFIKVAQNVMKTVGERLETASDAGVRGGFAALMMIRASNTETPAIKDAVIATLPSSVQETAKNEWLPAALASGDAQSYESMLGMAEAEVSRPVKEEVLRIAGVQQTEAMLADLSGAATDPALKPGEAQPVIDAVFAPMQYELPNLTVGDGVSDPSEQIGEIKGYAEQTTR